MGTESTEHFLLICSLFMAPREELLENFRPFIEPKLTPVHTLDNNSLIEILLYGHDDLSSFENKGLLNETIKYIQKTERFD